MAFALGPTDIPHTRRTPAAPPRAPRPAPAGRKGSDSLGRQQNEYVDLFFTFILFEFSGALCLA